MVRSHLGDRAKDETRARKNAMVIVVALIVGLATFGAIVFMLIQQGRLTPGPGFAPPGPGEPSVFGMGRHTALFAGVNALLMMSNLAIAVVMRRLLLRSIIDSETGEFSPESYMRATIIPAALCEGFGLFGVIIMLLSGQVLPGGVFVIVSIVALALLVPRRFVSDPFEAPLAGPARSPDEPEQW